MILEVATGRLIETIVVPLDVADLGSLGSGWHFDWSVAHRRFEVYRVKTRDDPTMIHAMIALTRRSNFVEVDLLECHPINVGRNKRFDGAAGLLFAFAAQLSFDLGGEGFVAFNSKRRCCTK